MLKNYLIFFFFLLLPKAGVSFAQQIDSLFVKETNLIYIAPGSKTNILEQAFYSENRISETSRTMCAVDTQITILEDTKTSGSIIYIKKETNQAIAKVAQQHQKTQKIAIKYKPDYAESKMIAHPFSKKDHKHTASLTFIAASPTLTVSKNNTARIQIIHPLVADLNFQIEEEEKLTKNNKTYGHTKSLQFIITYTAFSRPPTV